MVVRTTVTPLLSDARGRVGSVTRTQFYTAATVDGFIADPDDNLDWLMESDSGGIDRFGPFFTGIGAFVMGATTYEWMLRHAELVKWPQTYGDVPCWVFTHRNLPPFPGADVRFVSGDVRPVHAAMVQAAQGKDIWMVGGGELAGVFADAGLLDELIVGVAPVTLGAGKPLLPRRLTSSRLTLTGVEQSGQFAYLTYAVGAP
jgi:dihydrofolate reductase